MKAKIILMSFAFCSVVSAADWRFTSSYVLSGECHDYFISSAPGLVQFEPKAPVPYGHVGQGPTDDGVGGCRLFKNLMECQSRRGHFKVTSVDGPIFHFGPTVIDFSCQ